MTNKDILNIFKPKAKTPFPEESIHHNNCKCGRDIDYDMFLIDEYGIDTYLRVKKENQRQEEMMEKFGKINKLDLIPILACLMAFDQVREDETATVDKNDIRIGDVVKFKDCDVIAGVVLDIDDGYVYVLNEHRYTIHQLVDVFERYDGCHPVVTDNIHAIKGHVQEIYNLLQTLR